MEKSRKPFTKIISLLLVNLLLLPPFLTQACEKEKIEDPQSSCCCCCPQSKEPFLSEEGGQQQRCPCQMSERQGDESSPGVILSHHESKQETSLLISERANLIQDCITWFEGSKPPPSSLPNRDQPLYILLSSLLI